MKTYGSAVYAALQARFKGIEEIERLIKHLRIQAFLQGGSTAEWLECFWQQIGKQR